VLISLLKVNNLKLKMEELRDASSASSMIAVKNEGST
jgi:hypothetical protein